MANAESIYVDPSALLKLYLKEPESRAMTAWRAKVGDPLPVTHHGRVELTNCIALAAYRGIITGDAHDAALAALDDDFAQGRYKMMDVLWRATLKRAGDLSRGREARDAGGVNVWHQASSKTRIHLGPRSEVQLFLGSALRNIG